MTLHARKASTCLACGMPIMFEAGELAAPDDPAMRDVMCAFCGAITSRQRLREEAYDLSKTAAREPPTFLPSAHTTSRCPRPGSHRRPRQRPSR
jgi:hypothetical protein